MFHEFYISDCMSKIVFTLSIIPNTTKVWICEISRSQEKSDFLIIKKKCQYKDANVNINQTQIERNVEEYYICKGGRKNLPFQNSA